MTKADIIIIGGGPTGITAATELTEAGLGVIMVEQRHSLGGAIYRQPVAGVANLPGPAAKRWKVLSDRFYKAKVPVLFGHVFLGIDGDGRVLIEDRAVSKVIQMRAKAVLIATGAVEKIIPRPGWNLPGVSTAGGLQVMMKETGRAPKGRILLAGNGPLLVAVAAQMAKLGNSPVAVIEAGNPLTQMSASIGLMRSPQLVFEALSYLRQMVASGIPWLRASALTGIAQTENGLLATVRDKAEKQMEFRVDRIGLHDGIRSNNFGLPQSYESVTGKPLILHAGDCREALGAGAAEADGQRAARNIITALSATQASSADTIEKHRREHVLLARIFSPAKKSTPLSNLPDGTILCRCEQATVGDLKKLCNRSDTLSGREVKHNGRFAMGACQGRFCADNTAALMAELKPLEPPPKAQDLTGSRWPIRPVSIAALMLAEDGDE